MSNETELISVRVSEIGEFVRFHSCERRFKLGLNKRRLARAVPFSERLFNTLDPVLQEVGRNAEDRWETALQQHGLQDLTQIAERPSDQRYVNWSEFRRMLADLPEGTAAYGREVELEAPIGRFLFGGRIDFFVVTWDRGTVRVRIIEGKASRKDRTYHRLQLAGYLMVIRRLISIEPLIIAGTEVNSSDIECAVARIDEITNEPQDILERPTLNLDTEIADLERLLDQNGLLISIVDGDLDALDFQLNSKCDGCVFSVHCLPESARQRRLELIGVPPTVCRALRQQSICTIDQLAALDPDSELALAIKQSESFDANLPQLIALASARASTLAQGNSVQSNYQVQALPHAGASQLPQHEQQGQRLVRVYLQVDYDYSENRVGALSAHVTTSEYELHTPFDDETNRPSPIIVERLRTGDEEQPTYSERPVATASRDIIAFQTQPWTGIGDQDTGAERQLIQQFLYDLVDAVSEVSQAEFAPIHFYVYSRSEMTQLVEACSRAGSSLLSHLRELLGSRESLEQLIFSCLQDEIDTRYALGWTGRGLCVATSLSWYGQRFHWSRRVAGTNIELDRVFEQDIFDFRTTLDLREDGNWASGQSEAASRLRFEIRSRFHDTLTAPYWRAVWRSLPDPNDPLIADPRVSASIARYNRVNERPGLLRAYLQARVHALRWLDERVRFKNEEIEKPTLEIARLHEFELGVDTTGRAAIDFLRLDHHVKMTDWQTTHIQPPAARVQAGRSIPVRDVRADEEGTIHATFDLVPFGLTSQELSLRSAIDEGSLVRLSPRSGDSNRGQTLRQLTSGGMTCSVVAVDWEAGTIQLDAIYSNAATYVLGSYTPTTGTSVFDFASIDESPSDFVAGRVETQLRSGRGQHVFRWFEPSDPEIPPQTPIPPARDERIQSLLDSLELPHSAGRSQLTADQKRGVQDGLNARVQLLKGPPGTGKTVTTAASVLTRIAARFRTGNIVLIAAHTHLAVDTLMQRLVRYSEAFRQEALRQGLSPAPIVLTKVHSSVAPEDTEIIQNFVARSCVRQVNRWREEGVLIVGGTTSAMLKLAAELSNRVPYRDYQNGFQANALVVDEASMLVFPHFLALASLVVDGGEIMLAGDNRQLAPIVAHNWEKEDRPPAQHYQPFKSAYESVLRIVEESNQPASAVRQSPLTFTFRLPPIIRELIARVYRNLDDIELEGQAVANSHSQVPNTGTWGDIWAPQNGLVLVTHSERNSRQSNPLEGEIIRQILQARASHPDDSIAVITPHRAQRALLRGALAEFGQAVTVIDTVERLQGGERPTIFVSGTESDPHAIGAAASFILNLNRANVAFSRTQERLVVVCADTLLDHIPTELEDYESALLWKSLRGLCNRLVFNTDLNGVRVRVYVPPIRPEPQQD